MLSELGLRWATHIGARHTSGDPVAPGLECHRGEGERRVVASQPQHKQPDGLFPAQESLGFDEALAGRRSCAS